MKKVKSIVKQIDIKNKGIEVLQVFLIILTVVCLSWLLAFSDTEIKEENISNQYLGLMSVEIIDTEVIYNNDVFFNLKVNESLQNACKQNDCFISTQIEDNGKYIDWGPIVKFGDIGDKFVLPYKILKLGGYISGEVKLRIIIELIDKNTDVIIKSEDQVIKFDKP